MKRLSEEWLKSINEKFRQQDIHPSARPMLALSEFSKEFNASFIITPEISKMVSSWFKANTKPGSLGIGLMYQGAYYFDACFWSVDIFRAFGTRVPFEPLKSLQSMPDNLKGQITSNQEDVSDFIYLWADCWDYAYGFDDILIGYNYGRDDILKQNSINELAIRFIKSAHKELQATVSLLLQSEKPEPKAVETAGMAIEMFLKAILIIKNSWADEKHLIRIGHNLDASIDQCIALTNSDELRALKRHLPFFPAISSRYNVQEWEHSELWHGYAIAQSIGATFTRMFSTRDIKSNEG
jgi:hypothetical protein